MLEIHLSGYLDGDSSADLQRDVEAEVLNLRKHWKLAAVGLLYIDELVGFERARVAKTHGEWFKKMQPHLAKVAIVSSKIAITWAIAIAKLVTKTPLERFTEKEAATQWLASLEAKSAKASGPSAESSDPEAR